LAPQPVATRRRAKLWAAAGLVVMHILEFLFIRMFLHDHQDRGSSHEQKVTDSKRHDSLAI
jgi:hypothetical protein